MKIGLSCFKDTEIREIINDQDIGICDITNNEEPVYDTLDTDNDLSIEDYFIELLDIYTPEPKLPADFPEKYLKYIENALCDDWSIFNDSLPLDDIKTILKELCQSESDAAIFSERVGMAVLIDLEYLDEKSLIRRSSWKDFVKSIKEINRFHSKQINLDALKAFFKEDQLQLTIPKDRKELYRGRIGDDTKFSRDEMGPPPVQLASSGRANSEGVRCLYLASDVTTTLHEIRARDFDFISIGEFQVQEDLKFVDLSKLDQLSPFFDEEPDYEWFAINIPLLQMMSEEISKPLRRQDSVLDYLPAQYIVDFIKGLGFDGVCYKSTLNKGGLNYAVFNFEKITCINVELHYIDSLKYQSSKK